MGDVPEKMKIGAAAEGASLVISLVMLFEISVHRLGPRNRSSLRLFVRSARKNGGENDL